jgi:hypothetical protein
MPDHGKAKHADTTPSGGTTLDGIEATIRACAHDILAGFDRERVPPNVALAICGIIVSRLLDHAPHYRAEFIACLEQHHDA